MFTNSQNRVKYLVNVVQSKRTLHLHNLFAFLVISELKIKYYVETLTFWKLSE